MVAPSQLLAHASSAGHLCRPEGGPLYTAEVLKAMIDTEPTLASSAGAELAVAATAEEAAHVPKASAAHNSPGSQSAQAASAAACAEPADRSCSQAEAARPGSMPRRPGTYANAGSAGDVPNAGSGRTTEGLSLAGQASSLEASTAAAEAGGSTAMASSASNPVVEHSTAHGALLDGEVRDATEGVGGKEQTSSAEGSPVMPCSATAAGTAAAADSEGPSLPETVFLPAAIAATYEDASESEKRRECSEGTATASGSKLDTSQAVGGVSLTPQQHAVVAAVMVVMKRAMLEGHEASCAAKTRLLNNNWHTLVILQLISDGEELPSIKDIEQRLNRSDQIMVDMLALQCAAAGFQPLQVFTRSAQCGVKTACRAGHKRVPARHQQVAELDRVFQEYSFPATWGKDNVDLMVQQGVHESMATLIMLLLLLLTELCKRCFRPSDDWQTGAGEYAALDHLFPGSCPSYITTYRHATLVASISEVMTQLIQYICSCKMSMGCI